MPARPGRVAIGVIARSRSPELERLAVQLPSLAAAWPHAIAIAVEAGVDAPRVSARSGGCTWIELPRGRGFGYNRNRLLEELEGEVVVLLDDSCEPAEDWLERLLEALAPEDVDAVVGRVAVAESSRLGNAIAALGFPAGGRAGYETMFEVDARGRTDNLTTANCALKRRVLDRLGGFDEAMVHGGEDTELAHRMARAGMSIAYAPDAVVSHPPRTGLGAFARWFFRRGRAKHGFMKKVPGSGRYVRRRLKSMGVILWRERKSAQLLLVLPLMLLSLVAQQAGFLYEAIRSRSR